MVPHSDQIHLNYCGVMAFWKEIEGAPIPKWDFEKF